jgi:hypothetical protein
MWRAYGPEAGLCALVALLATSCGTRSLDLMIVESSEPCSFSIPAGSSILYDLHTSPSPTASNDPPLCSSCLRVPEAVSSITKLNDFLRVYAVDCKGIRPGSYLWIRLSAWNSSQCNLDPQGGPILCADSVKVEVPNGRQDDKVTLVLACQPQLTCGGG